MKIPGFAELTEFERAHFSAQELASLNAEAASLKRPRGACMDDSTLTARDYMLDGIMTQAWHAGCPCGWTSGPVYNQEQAVQATEAHRRTDCPGYTINGGTA